MPRPTVGLIAGVILRTARSGWSSGRPSWPSLLTSLHGAQDDSRSEADDNQISDHLTGDKKTRRIGGCRDVAKANRGEHGHGEVQRVGVGHGLAEAEVARSDGGENQIGAGE